jgi:hypothetical protein
MYPPAGYAGTPSWTQVITAASSILSGPGMQTVNCPPPNSAPWLDGASPDSTATTTNGNTTEFDDEPGPIISLIPNGVANVANQVAFVLYLMWQPTGVGTAFSVPLGNMGWSVNDSFVLTNGTWRYSTGGASVPSWMSISASYPLWNSSVQGGQQNLNSCTPIQ